LGGSVTYAITHKIDGAALAQEQKAHSDDISRINATAAQQLADAIAKRQVAEGKVVTIQQQYEQEIANHAKDALDFRARLLAGTQRVRVRTVAGSCAGAASQSTSTAPGTDDTASYADIAPAVAAGVYAVADQGDAEIIKLRRLQEYIKGLQDDGYINK